MSRLRGLPRSTTEQVGFGGCLMEGFKDLTYVNNKIIISKDGRSTLVDLKVVQILIIS